MGKTVIINGLRPVGALGQEYFNDKTEDYIMALRAGNTTVERGVHPLLSFINSKTKTVERKLGQSIKMETFNVLFTDGGFSSNGYGFDKYVEEFELPKENGMNAVTYDFPIEEILQARENGIDLLKKIQEQTMAYISVYQNNVLPYRAIQTLLTGASLSTKVLPEANGNDSYGRGFGWLRGEDVTDLLKAHLVKGDGHRCHYRGTKGKAFSYTDIYDAVDLLKSYKESSPLKPFALANTRTIQNTIGSVVTAPDSVDEIVINGVGIKYREALGCRWIDVDTYLPEGIVVMLDAQTAELCIKTVSPDEEQRGIAFVKQSGGEAFKLESAEDFAGGKVHVFPEELLIPKRHLGLILDTENQGQTASGKEGWATETTINKLQDFAKSMRDSYYIEMK